MSRNPDQELTQSIAAYYPRVYVYCRHLVRDGAAAEDLAQEVFVRLFETGSEWATVRNQWHFITAVIKNVFREFLRSKTRGPALAETDSTPAKYASADVSIGGREGSDAVRQLLDELPLDQRFVLVARYYLDMTIRDIAADLGVSTATVLYKHANAMRTLRSLALERGVELEEQR